MSSRIPNIDKTKADIASLDAFINQSFARDSYVFDKTTGLIASMQKEVRQHEEALRAQDCLTLKVQVNFGNATSTRSIVLSRDATLQDLKAAVEAQFGGEGLVERIKVRKSGRAWGQLDARTLASCDIHEGEEVVADCRSAQSLQNYDSNLRGLSRVPTSSAQVTNELELLATAWHCFLLDLGFVCVVEQPNATPGFAPSLRELPTGVLLPPGWNSQQEVSLLYKHKARLGKQFLLQVSPTGDGIALELSQRKSGAAPARCELKAQDFVSAGVSPGDSGTVAWLARLTNLENFVDQVLRVVQQVVPELVSDAARASLLQQEAPADQLSGLREGLQETGRQQPAVEQPRFQPQPSVLQPPVRGPEAPRRSAYDTGRGDLDPFPQAGGLFAPRPVGGLPPAQPGSGSLVGPDHPMFVSPPAYPEDPYAPRGDFFFPGGGLGPDAGQLPQPRFDPFGPVVGPHSGVDVGDPGVTSPFGPGRGRGRGRNFPGEPNPDHLKPPGW